ncbi:hypothetical protein, partial [Mycobacteroides abscessus]|uniref:hypothetical protein n=3 Tax=Mycobacteroides abscessus TaxID=36809 RepID=UPI001A948F97
MSDEDWHCDIAKSVGSIDDKRGEAERSHETDCRITTLDSDEVATTRVVKVIDMQRDSIRQSEGRSPSGNEPVTMKIQGAQQNSTIGHEQGGVSRRLRSPAAPAVLPPA